MKHKYSQKINEIMLIKKEDNKHYFYNQFYQIVELFKTQSNKYNLKLYINIKNKTIIRLILRI